MRHSGKRLHSKWFYFAFISGSLSDPERGYCHSADQLSNGFMIPERQFGGVKPPHTSAPPHGGNEGENDDLPSRPAFFSPPPLFPLSSEGIVCQETGSPARMTENRGCGR
ncbi:hypothetical protein PHYPO_G00140150 [Pangasianodon hypophthalmus]|uniref:Uncharacterized protein n=2 Tax=Pangasiidae TaxID=7999 RepID=A0A5N5KD55_PANHP|nr:hypothetical protein PHYPO_G00140150 [Pangasianodon hypophthalmus]